MARKQRYFVKLDRNAKPVVGSLIERPKRPKHDNWQEFVPLKCCNGAPIEVVLPTLTGGQKYGGTIGCQDQLTVTFNSNTTTLTSLVTYLNDTYDTIGSFTPNYNNTGVIFTPNIEACENPVFTLVAS